MPDPHVRDVKANGEGDVAGQRPGGRRPGEEVGPGLILELELHIDRGIFDIVLVSQRQLVAGEGCLVAGTVGHDLESLVEQLFVPDLFENPPDTLHVGGVEGPVGLVEIDPVAHPFGHVGELVDVLEDALPAELVEGLDPKLLDVLLAGKFQLLLDLDLDRETVRVPSGLAIHVKAPHRLVAGEQVLQCPCQHVVDAWKIVGGGGPFVKNEGGSSLALLEALVKDVALFPEGQHGEFQLGEPGARRNFLEHGRQF